MRRRSAESRDIKTTIFITALGAAIFAYAPLSAAYADNTAPENTTDNTAMRLAIAVEPDKAYEGRKANSPGYSPSRSELPGLDDAEERRRAAAVSALNAADRAALTRKLALWITLRERNSKPEFDAASSFVTNNPGWPLIGRIRRKAEEAITAKTSDKAILAWFDAHPPLTPNGALAHADALRRGKDDRLDDMIRQAWIKFNMGSAIEKDFVARYGKRFTAEDHWARLDRLLWENRVGPAQRQMKRVDKDHRALAQARLLLMRKRRGIDAALAKIPASLADDPGLAYERLRWRRRKDMNDGAVEILLSSPDQSAYPKKWWREREIIVRRLLEEGDSATVYEVLRNHGLTEDSPSATRAAAEFLAGWVALRFRDDPKAAFGHFTTMHGFVGYPISVARASYWAGRAAEASDDTDIAQQWYRLAANHATTFYGQLAAERLREPLQLTLLRDPAISLEAMEAFDRDELVGAIRLMADLRDGGDKTPKGADKETVRSIRIIADANEEEILPLMLRHIARRGKTADEWALAARLARETEHAHVAVYVARRSARYGVVLGDLGYPTMAVSDETPPDSALVHALVRQESSFDPGARSRAGARGLMQLMPATAKRMARSLKVRNHSTARLTSDPGHNMLLGSAYLDSMLGRFDGSMVMALAAYNAGPTSVKRWIKSYGYPRGSLDRSIDWIESIPYSETRNYVQRILETLPIYRWKLGDGQIALLQPEDLTGPDTGNIASP